MKEPPNICVHNRQRKAAVDANELEQFAQRALLLCLSERRPVSGLTNLREIHVLLVSDRKLSELHRRFMGLIGPTDVITFQHGEIFISVETARRQAQAQRTSLAYEICLYLVHGLLHLHGFDDHLLVDRRRMCSVQERIVASARQDRATNG